MTSPAAATAATTSTTPHTAPQGGIINRPPEHALIAALELTGNDPRGAVERVRDVVHGELTSTLAADADPSTPPPETGELGYSEHHDRAHLTITVGFSSSGYDKLQVAQADRPADLIAIPWTRLGDAPDNADSGDLIVQICADNTFITEHVLRRIEHALASEVRIVWAHTGAQRYTSRSGRVATHEGRGWIGFLDGTSNLDPAHNDADRALVLVDPDATGTYPALPQPSQPTQYGPNNQPGFPTDLRAFTGTEPSWTRNGSYLTARISVTDLPAWDSTPLATQEQTIGRTKKDGISLDLAGVAGATDQTPPDFASNPSDEQVAITAHIRKANPRSADDLPRRIFRRGYPLYEGSDGTLRRGLAFLAYGRTLSTQFEFIFCAWLTNPDFPRPGAGVDRLRAFDSHVLAGGYYFVPPLDEPSHPWSWHVPPAATTP